MRFTRARAALIAAAAVTVVAPLAAVSPAQADWGDRTTVMSRNIYLGADLNRPVVAAATAEAQGAGQAGILVALANATHETRDIVDATNFGVRSRLLAREIDFTNPDLIGLQEVALWRSGPLQLDQVGVANATTVDYDFLQMLLAELAKRGENYRAVVTGTRADVEVPSFTGSPFDGTMGGAVRDVRLTMRDVILLRVNSGLKVLDTADKVYNANLSIPVGGVEFRFDRGYQYVDVSDGSEQTRFVNTHLESASSDLAAAQATQVVAEATSATTRSILVCDCNSDPKNSTVAPGDSVPNNAAYNVVRAQYADQSKPTYWWQTGFTYGLSETVDDARSSFVERIDFVFGRTAAGDPLSVRRTFVVGDRVWERDRDTGLWPADHGGVVVKVN